MLFEADRKSSIRLIPKITAGHLTNIKHNRRMKVELATAVLSNSVAAALDFYSANALFGINVLSTSSYLKRFNDIFDVMNSSNSRDPNKLKRPLSTTSDGTSEGGKFRSPVRFTGFPRMITRRAY